MRIVQQNFRISLSIYFPGSKIPLNGSIVNSSEWKYCQSPSMRGLLCIIDESIVNPFDGSIVNPHNGRGIGITKYWDHVVPIFLQCCPNIRSR